MPTSGAEQLLPSATEPLRPSATVPVLRSGVEPLLPSGAEPLLLVAGLTAGYGKLRVLHGVDITVGRGELIAILGPNGAGKSTLLCTIAGLLPKHAGRVVFDGRDLAGLGAKDTVRLGIAHVIQDHRIFTHLSVQDICCLPATTCRVKRTWRVSRKSMRCSPRLPPSGTSSAPRSPAGSSRCWRWRRGWCAGPSS